MKVDTGDHWNPRDHGTLQYVPLDLAGAAAQAWVLGLCEDAASAEWSRAGALPDLEGVRDWDED